MVAHQMDEPRSHNGGCSLCSEQRGTYILSTFKQMKSWKVIIIDLILFEGNKH